MKYIILNNDEKKIDKDFVDGKYKSVANTNKSMNQYRKYAQATMGKTKNINIRLSEKDLLKIKARAVEQGLPYQTLASSVLHQYLSTK